MQRGEYLIPVAKVPSTQPPSRQHGEPLAPAAKSPIMQPSSLQPVAIPGQPALAVHQEHRDPDVELPPTIATHHGRSEHAMEIPRSHYERRVEPEASAMPTDRDVNAEGHSMMRPHDGDARPGMYGRPRGPMMPRFAPGFARYPPSEYYHDPRMPHAPQAPHGPQHQYRSGGYHDAPYRDNQDGYEGYVESYWHPPSHAYFGSGGRYEHGYGREYPNEYPKDQEDGGQAP
ncbi:hypothetical protein DFJ58DRAFT_729625 [Suillus subalutaceus]|uniref:uncharacterized protein n=1 Tax=Suillus subalutaceus TaxID=48586 RepID=UPI001B87DA40|nr:uncharacterized protein DFJ58DRAFT_729625 [Suillus subalutaceus]KAG1849136.1 hypothetical protein DFJ58DRAFT_729625 [Suillus subalutaceus]